MTSNSNNLFKIAVIASVVAGISPAILIALIAFVVEVKSPAILIGLLLVVSLLVIPLTFTANLPLIYLGNKLISKFDLHPISQFFLLISMGLIGALAALLLIFEATSWFVELNAQVESYYLYGSIVLIAAITSWLLYNFGPLRIEMSHSNKTPAVELCKTASLSTGDRSAKNSSAWKKIIRSFALLSFYVNVGIGVFIYILSVKLLNIGGEVFHKPGNFLIGLLIMFASISGGPVAGGLFGVFAIISGLTCLKIESAHIIGLVLRSFILFVLMVPAAIFAIFYFAS